MLIKSQSRFSALLLGALFVASLSACHAGNLTHEDNQPSMCKKLKRQMMYNKFNRNTEAAWSAPSQRERLRQLYFEYQCG